MSAWSGFSSLQAGGGATLALLLLVVLLVVALTAQVRARQRARQKTRALADSLQHANDELEQVAWRDALTGLANRAHFEAQLLQAERRCEEENRPLAVLFIDLDAFKPVNQSFGHRGGDLVLQEVARRLDSLAVGSILAARVGADQFLMLVEGGRDQAAALAQCVVALLHKKMTVGGRDLHLTCSIGVAVYPDHGAGTPLLSRADTAMGNAKRSGGAAYAFYEPQMDASVPDNLGLLGELRTAIAQRQLELLYQPKVDARSGQITAAEALLRWNHPKRGLIPPSVFVPIAERYGLITAIGQWVIEDACRQARAWRDSGLRMRVAVNLSAQQMRHEDLVLHIQALLARYGVRPEQLTCEITESLAMSDTAATKRTFERLGEAGVHVSIDDFGTGHSSLAYLRQLPAEELKIDRSFVLDLEHSDDARSIVEAIVQLAHALGLKVVAEGVETERQRELLCALGCDELQGYLFARPMPASALTRWATGDDDAAPLDFRPSLFSDTMPAEAA